MLAGVAAGFVVAFAGLYLLVVEAGDGGGPAWWYLALLALAGGCLGGAAGGKPNRNVLLVATVLVAVPMVLGLLTIGGLLIIPLVLILSAYGAPAEIEVRGG